MTKRRAVDPKREIALFWTNAGPAGPNTIGVLSQFWGFFVKKGLSTVGFSSSFDSINHDFFIIGQLQLGFMGSSRTATQFLAAYLESAQKSGLIHHEKFIIEGPF